MPHQGEVARQWFIPGEGIDRHVISTDLQRYLGNDATVRPGVGSGEYQGVQGYWIKAYRNLTSAMIADLRSDSHRWRQEQRQAGSADTYASSRTFDQSNAARPGFRRDGGNNSPLVDDYQRPSAGGPGRSHDPMQIDPRAPQGYGQAYSSQDPRGAQYPPNASRGYGPPGGAQPYMEQAMMDGYGQPDREGRFQVNPYGQDRPPQNYRAPQGPPTGYVQQGDLYVPNTSGAYLNSGMGATAPSYQVQYDSRGNPVPPQVAQPPRGHQYADYQPNPYPSPAQTVPDINPRNPPPPSAYPYSQGQYDNSGRPSGPGYGQPQYAQDSNYPPPSRDSNTRSGQPSMSSSQRDTDRRHRRNG